MNYFKYYLLIMLGLIFSCESSLNKNKFKNTDTFVPFQFVFQEVNPVNEEINYVRIDKKLTSDEISYLKNILKNKGKECKITSDSLLLISTLDYPDLSSMNLLSTTLFEELKKNGHIPVDSLSWYYKE